MKAVALQSSEAKAPVKNQKPEVHAVPFSQWFPQTISVNEGPIQRKAECACGGGCPRCQESGFPPGNLAVTKPGDPHEQEADRVAARALAMPDRSSPEEPELHKHGVVAAVHQECNACSVETHTSPPEEESNLQKKSDDNSTNSGLSSIPGLGASGGGGQPLSKTIRQFFEPRFGYDFSRVRVHADARAVGLSQALRAEAFTYGNDIYFNARRFAPGSAEGKSLLAHELAHTIQQRGAVERKIQRREVCDEQGVCRSEPDPELNYTPNEPVASGTANSTPSVPLTVGSANYSPNIAAVVGGASLLPPGDCTPAEHRILQNEVDRACDRQTRCTQNDSCPDIWQKIGYNAECIRARAIINARCFRGGDIGHGIALANAVLALGNCWIVYNRRCQSEPNVPVPVPVRVPVSRPVVDRGFMERMAALTGLSGAALVLYLIVSEGSRLFPPRNLIPVP
jgi:hypothetical protein